MCVYVYVYVYIYVCVCVLYKWEIEIGWSDKVMKYFIDLVIMYNPGLILGLHRANERRRYFVTKSLIGWVQD